MRDVLDQAKLLRKHADKQVRGHVFINSDLTESEAKEAYDRRVLKRISRPVVPNLWPAGQMWPARPQKVALDLLKNFKNICAKTAKLPILTE